MKSIEESKESYRELTQKHAKEAFKNHVLTKEADTDLVKMFMCRNPDSSFYWFRVIFAPGCITVYGDIGEAIYIISDRDSLKWLLSAHDSFDYILGKMRAPTEKVFLTRSADEELDNLKKTYSEGVAEKVDMIRDSWDGENYEEFCELYYQHFDDMPNLTDHSNLFTTLALQKFVELYNNVLLPLSK